MESSIKDDSDLWLKIKLSSKATPAYINFIFFSTEFKKFVLTYDSCVVYSLSPVLYASTRRNVGLRVLDLLCHKLHISKQQDTFKCMN